MPAGLGKAISNSVPSPCPFTLTTVPIPHLPCSALSPTFQPVSSPPDAAAEVGRITGFRGVVGVVNVPLDEPNEVPEEPNEFPEDPNDLPPALNGRLDCCSGSTPSIRSCGISAINLEAGFILVLPNKVLICALVINKLC